MIKHLADKANNIIHIGVNYDISACGLEAALMKVFSFYPGAIDSSFSCTLYVGKRDLSSAKAAIVTLLGDSFYSIHIDDMLNRDAWYVKVNDLIVYSEGA